jgi:hypothetical protein
MNGWYIKDVGDAVLAVFKNAVDALSFAMELEKNTGHEMVRITAGAHIGTVIIRGNDIFGNEVNLAARIQDKAMAGEVWVSDGVRAEWRSRHGPGSLAFARHPNIELKGLDEPITLWSVEPTFPKSPARGSEVETGRVADQKPRDQDKAKEEAKEAERQRQIVLDQAAAAAAAGKPEVVEQFIKSHPEWRAVLGPYLRQAEKVKEEAKAAERQRQLALSRAADAAAAGKPEVVEQIIKSHPEWREGLEPYLRQAEKVKEEAKQPERQRQIILEKAAAAAFAGKPEEVRQLMESYPQWRQDLESLLGRADVVKAEAEKAMRHLRQLQIILNRASAAAAAGKPEDVRILMEKHGPFREQLTPLWHQAIEAQVQSRAKEAATQQAIEALKGLVRTHKSALKSQPVLVKTLESSVAEAEARVHKEIKIKLLEEKILAEARERVAAAHSDRDIQLLDLWAEEQIGRLPAPNPGLAVELRALVTQAQRALLKARKASAQPNLSGWKPLDMARSQAKQFAEEGNLDGLRSLIAENPRWEPQLASYLRETFRSYVKRQALCAATDADVTALEELIQQHRDLLDQDVLLAAEFDESLQQARSSIKARFKRRMLMWCVILASLAAVGAAIGVMLSRQAPK